MAAGLPPVLAPPVLRRGAFQLCQSGAILQYIGRKYGLAQFDSLEDEAQAEALHACVQDYFSEGRNAFHPVDPLGSYRKQVDAARPYIARFAAERMPRFVRHFEAVLRANQPSPFCVGPRLTWADLALFQAVRATEAQWGDAFARMRDVPLLRAFGARMAERPRLAAYLASPRCQPFSGDSMM